MLRTKRIYDEPAHADGYRILVDRLWPRGITKEHAALDLWLKEIAPSNELRKWYHGRDAGANFEEFAGKYEAELRDNPAVEELKKLMREHKSITLLYGARDPELNHAKVLARFLKGKS